MRDTARWLQYAKEDLLLAAIALARTDVPARESCWLAQQAAEKAVKALLVFLGIDFLRTHNLDALCRCLPDDSATRIAHPDLGWLTGWAVEARYPGDWPEATSEDARQAVEQGQTVVESVTNELKLRGFTDSVQIPPP
jgi:HEPN domain-containing protein